MYKQINHYILPSRSGAKWIPEGGFSSASKSLRLCSTEFDCPIVFKFYILLLLKQKKRQKIMYEVEDTTRNVYQRWFLRLNRTPSKVPSHTLKVYSYVLFIIRKTRNRHPISWKKQGIWLTTSTQVYGIQCTVDQRFFWAAARKKIGNCSVPTNYYC